MFYVPFQKEGEYCLTPVSWYVNLKTQVLMTQYLNHLLDSYQTSYSGCPQRAHQGQTRHNKILVLFVQYVENYLLKRHKTWYTDFSLEVDNPYRFVGQGVKGQGQTGHGKTLSAQYI